MKNKKKPTYSSINERFDELIFFLRTSATQLAKELNISQTSMSRTLRGDTLPSSKILIPLLEAYPQINMNWLLIGQGEMLITISSSEGTIDNTIVTQGNVKNTINANNSNNAKNDSKIQQLEAEVKHLKKEIKALNTTIKSLHATNKAINETKSTLENQIKDKELIISMLQGK